jgi:transposase InsO family protein
MENESPLIPLHSQSIIPSVAEYRREKDPYGIEKFDGHDYSLWKYQAQTMLEDEGFWDIVDPKQEPNLTTEEMKRKDRRAGVMLIKIISRHQLAHITHTRSGREIWAAFSGIHEAKSVRHQRVARKTYYNMKMQQKETVTQFMTRVKVAAEKLSSFNVDVDERDQCHTVLEGLTDIFSGVANAIDLLPVAQLTWTFLTGTLLQEELKHQSKEDKSENLMMGQANISKGKRFCTICKKEGHTLDFCWYNPDGKNYGKGPRRGEPRSAPKHEEKRNTETAKIMVVEQGSIKFLNMASVGYAYNPNEWILDSGASKHFCGSKDYFINLSAIQPIKIKMGNDSTVEAKKMGDIIITLKHEGINNTIRLSEVLYVPEITTNLMSVSELSKAGYGMVFKGEEGTILTPTGKICAQGIIKEGLYTFEGSFQKNYAFITSHISTRTSDYCLWHSRYGHLHSQGLSRLINGKMVHGLPRKLAVERCILCAEAKISKTPISLTRIVSKSKLELLFLDLCGPLPVVSLGGAKYFLTITDDYSKYLVVYCIKTKSEAITKFKEYIALTKNQFGKYPKALRSDNGGEFKSHEWTDLCTSLGIQRQFTAVQTPQQNGVSERANRTLMEMVRCLLHQRNLSAHYWGEAVQTAAYIRNRSPKSKLRLTPYELWFRKKPRVSHLRVFGCVAVVHLPLRHDKLIKKGEIMIFIGYSQDSQTYRFLNPVTMKFVASRDAEFFENSSFNFDAYHSKTVVTSKNYVEFVNPSELFVHGESNPKKKESEDESAIESEILTEKTKEMTTTTRVENNDEKTKFTCNNVEDQKSQTSVETNRNVTKGSAYNADQSVIIEKTEANPEEQVENVCAEIVDGAAITCTIDKTKRKRNIRWKNLIVDEADRLEQIRRTDFDKRIEFEQSLLNNSNKEIRSAPPPTKVNVRTTSEIESSVLLIDHEEEPPMDTSEIVIKARARKMPMKYADYKMFFASDLPPEPKTYAEAVASIESQEWIKAINDELSSHDENGTWTVVPSPNQSRLIKTKWIFKRKFDNEGRLSKYKARLVAKGFSQKEGVDYDQIFAPVARPTSVRALLSYAAIHDFEIIQLDVKTAFLNGVVAEDLYLEAPQGSDIWKTRGLACKLNKALYGLKQASRCWNERFDSFMKKRNFIQNRADDCMYHNREGGRWISVVIYVDDILIVADTSENAKWTKNLISAEFKITDLGDAKYYLGVEIVRDREKRIVYLNQRKYVDDITEKFGLVGAKIAPSPMEEKLDFSQLNDDANGEASNETEYRQIIGSLQYLVNWTRPEINNAVVILSQFLIKPKNVHRSAALRIVRYLSGTKHHCLTLGDFDSKPNELTVYVDADWGNSLINRKSISGFVFQYCGAPIAWKSKKQSNNALSSTEAEFNALVLACKEAIWLRRLYTDILRVHHVPLMFLEDNQGAIALSENNVFHDRSKHMENKVHWLRDFFTSNFNSILYCSTEFQLADIMTKSLGNVRFARLRDALKIRPALIPCERYASTKYANKD